jgi:hypothetical protein
MNSCQAAALAFAGLALASCAQQQRGPALIALDQRCQTGDVDACRWLVSMDCQKGEMSACRMLCQEGDQAACVDYSRGAGN